MRVGLVIFPVLNFFIERFGPVVVTEQLVQVPGHLVAVGPLVVLGVPGWHFLLFGGRFLLSGWLLALGTLGLDLFLLLFLLLGLREGLLGCLELRLCTHASQVDAASDRANIANDAKEFIHNAGLHAIFLTLKLLAIHHALEKNETLTSAILGNLLLNQLHYKGRVEVDGRVLTLFIWINGLGRGAELDVFDAL